MKKVISVVLNNFCNDSRVLKECKTLTNANYNVKVLALHDGKLGLKENDIIEGIKVQRLLLFTKK